MRLIFEFFFWIEHGSRNRFELRSSLGPRTGGYRYFPPQRSGKVTCATGARETGPKWPTG